MGDNRIRKRIRENGRKKGKKGKRKETREKKAATGVESVLLSAGERRSRDNTDAFVRACSHLHHAAIPCVSVTRPRD